MKKHDKKSETKKPEKNTKDSKKESKKELKRSKKENSKKQEIKESEEKSENKKTRSKSNKELPEETFSNHPDFSFQINSSPVLESKGESQQSQLERVASTIRIPSQEPEKTDVSYFPKEEKEEKYKSIKPDYKSIQGYSNLIKENTPISQETTSLDTSTPTNIRKNPLLDSVAKSPQQEFYKSKDPNYTSKTKDFDSIHSFEEKIEKNYKTR